MYYTYYTGITNTREILEYYVLYVLYYITYYIIIIFNIRAGAAAANLFLHYVLALLACLLHMWVHVRSERGLHVL